MPFNSRDSRIAARRLASTFGLRHPTYYLDYVCWDHKSNKLRIDFCKYDNDAAELTTGWNHVVNLTDLTIAIPNVECITTVLATPKSKLRKLNLKINKGQTKEIMYIYAALAVEMWKNFPCAVRNSWKLRLRSFF